MGAFVGVIVFALAIGLSRSSGACSYSTSFVGTIELVNSEVVSGSQDVSQELRRWLDGGLVEVESDAVGNDVMTLYFSDFTVEAQKTDE